MIWWFLILGVSALVVVCVAIVLYVQLRHSLRKSQASHDDASRHLQDGHSSSRER